MFDLFTNSVYNYMQIQSGLSATKVQGDCTQMKKIISAILAAAILSSSALFVGCSGDNGTTTANTTGAQTTAPSFDISKNLFPELAESDTVPVVDYVCDDYLKYITVSDLSDITLSLDEAEQQYRKYVTDMLKKLQTYTESEDAPAQKGDRVTIFFKGSSAEGKTFSDETLGGMDNTSNETGYTLILGTHVFVGEYKDEQNPDRNAKGFEEQLIGAKKGDKLTVTVRFSPLYDNKELRDELVNFEVEMVKVETADPSPTLTDEVIKEHTQGEYTDVKSFEKYMTDQYKGQIAYDAIMAKIKINSLPEEDVETYAAEYINNYYEYNNTDKDKLTEDELKKLTDEADAAARAHVGQRLIWNYLFGVYGISMTKGEFIATLQSNYDTYSDYYAYYYEISDIEEFVTVFGANNLLAQFLQQKMIPVMCEKVKWASSDAES